MTTPRTHAVPVSQGGDTRAYTHDEQHRFKFGYCMCQCDQCATASNCICPDCKCNGVKLPTEQETTDGTA